MSLPPRPQQALSSATLTKGLTLPSPYSGPDDRSIYVDANTRIQIIETMMDLPTADKEQNAAFVVSLFISGHLVPALLPFGIRLRTITPPQRITT